MKRFKHILAYTLIILLVLILSLILVAELAENRVTRVALKYFNEQIDATIDVGDVDFSLIKTFPDAMVELNNVSVFTQADTLAHIKRVFVSVEMRPLFNSQFKITEVTVEGGIAYYKIDSLGRTNFDAFLVPSEEPVQQDTTESTILLSLKHLELTNLFCSYTDEQSNVSACLYIDNGLSVIYIDEDNTKASFKGKLRANNCHYPSTNLYLMDETSVDADVAYLNNQLTINSLKIESDGVEISLNGEVNNQQSIYSDLHISSPNIHLSELSKYIPDSLLQTYDIEEIDGVASFSADINGEYNDSVMPQIDVRYSLAGGRLSIKDQPQVNSIKLVGTYSNGELQNNTTTKLVIDTLYLASGGSWFNVNGQVVNLDKTSYLLQSDIQLDLSDVVPFVPNSLVNHLEGQLRMKLATQGVIPDSFDIAFADYLLERTQCQLIMNDITVGMDSLVNISNLNGQLNYTPKSLKVDSLKLLLPDYQMELTSAGLLAGFSGQLSNTNSLAVNIDELDIQTAGSALKGQLSFRNPERPIYSIDADATINLAEMKVFAPDSLISNMEGLVTANVHSAGIIHLDSITDNLMKLLFTSSRLTTGFNNVSIAGNDELMQLQALNGTVALVNDSISIDKLSGELAGITFDSDSSLIQNFYKGYWLNQPDTVKVDGYINLGDIDYVLFEPLMAEEQGETNEPEVIAEPANYRFAAKGKLTAKSFWYGNALFENLSALYNVSDSLYIADQIKFDAFKGSTNSSVKVQMLHNNEMKINFKNVTEGLDINQLLYDFDDFMDYTDEVYISHEQLSGMFSTDSLHGQIVFVGDSLDLERFKLTAKLRLEDGRIRDYPITAEMADDYNFPELKDLQFKTLDTKLFTHGGAVFVPLTDVKTNAFDIAILGKQEFNLDCQYHLRFYLKEILRKGKTDRIEKKQAGDDTKKGGGVKGLASMFAIYKVQNGKTEKSTIEGKDSDAKKKLRSQIYLKEAMAKLEFHPLIVTYQTGVED